MAKPTFRFIYHRYVAPYDGAPPTWSTPIKAEVIAASESEAWAKMRALFNFADRDEFFSLQQVEEIES